MKKKIVLATCMALVASMAYAQGVKMSTFSIAPGVDTGRMRFVVVYDAGGSYQNQQLPMGAFINYLGVAFTSAVSTGYGIDYASLSFKVDSAAVFPDVLHTLAAGYGLNYSGRTYAVDTNKVTTKESRQKGMDSVHELMTTYYKDSTWTNEPISFTPTTLVTNKLYTVSYNITAQAGPLLINNSISSWANGQILMFYIKGTASRALTYGSDYVAGSDVALPSSTTGTKTLILEFHCCPGKLLRN